MLLTFLAIVQEAAQSEAVMVAKNTNALLGAGIGIGLAIVDRSITGGPPRSVPG